MGTSWSNDIKTTLFQRYQRCFDVIWPWCACWVSNYILQLIKIVLKKFIKINKVNSVVFICVGLYNFWKFHPAVLFLFIVTYKLTIDILLSAAQFNLLIKLFVSVKGKLVPSTSCLRDAEGRHHGSHLPNFNNNCNKLKWVAFSEINRPKTRNYPTRSYKILQNPEFTPPPPPPPYN